MLETNIIKDDNQTFNDLLIIKKYETFLDYVYPICQNIPRNHGFFKNQILTQLFEIPDLINDAAKSNQVSKIYLVDSAIASIRFKMRFMDDKNRKLITQHQHEVSQRHLSEVGAMIGAWIKKKKG